MVERKRVFPSELGSVEYEFELVRNDEEAGPGRCLVIKIVGSLDEGTAGNKGAQLIRGIIAFGTTLWFSEALLLDFSMLHYSWGNRITRIFDSVEDSIEEKDLRVGLVCSLENEVALRDIWKQRPDLNIEFFRSVEAGAISLLGRSPIGGEK